MHIQTETKEHVVVIRLMDDLVLAEGEELKKALVDLASQSRTKIVIDMTGAKFVDSSGLGILLWAMKNMRQRGGDVRLFGLSKMVRDIFEITELRQAFQVFETERQALASYAADENAQPGQE